MFFQPPPPSEEEIRQQEADASFAIQRSVVAAVLLYLSPFAIDAVKMIF
ncbi:hypothetical protein CFIMG_004291RA [Ceratocystis fimbriata CBS 114723]|uniref:Mitochondrial import receptor subunit tom5 n=1 Tax=Ceratocystis fimbriata CBS 114723 TaxID=1035309 RepID=A0A2C5X1D0_9PEZI|nr:hypothetical protein CFIMG_004291RA [Ceratocystis fimbriata CBS 114723]